MVRAGVWIVAARVTHRHDVVDVRKHRQLGDRRRNRRRGCETERIGDDHFERPDLDDASPLGGKPVRRPVHDIGLERAQQ